MSIKIYNAYICDKVYSMHELMQKVKTLRAEIVQLANNKRKHYIVSQCVHLQDFRAVRGLKETQMMRAKLAANKKEKMSDYSLVEMWKVVSEEEFDTRTLMDAIDSHFLNKAYEDGKSNRRIDSDFDYNCSMMVIPMENKQLVLVFGNDELTEVVKNQPWLRDYHYQNQTDCPANISEEEWEQRRKDWDEAIGPDYLPVNHGMEIKLCDSGRDFLFGIMEEEWTKDFPPYVPSVEDRVKWLIDYFDDYPDPPSGSYSVDWVKYLRSEKYLNWKQQKYGFLVEQIKEHSVVL